MVVDAAESGTVAGDEAERVVVRVISAPLWHITVCRTAGELQLLVLLGLLGVACRSGDTGHRTGARHVGGVRVGNSGLWRLGSLKLRKCTSDVSIHAISVWDF